MRFERFGLSRECKPSGIVGLGAKPDGMGRECAIRLLEIDRMPASVIPAVRGQEVKVREDLGNHRDLRSLR
jgi:hypothetical protein